MVRPSVKKYSTMQIKRRRNDQWIRISTPLRFLLVFGVGATILLIRSKNDSFHYGVVQKKIGERCTILSRLSKEELSQLETMDLSNCQLTEIPKNIQFATYLKKLDVGQNSDLTTLPKELKFCRSLDTLFASSCPSMKNLPSVLGEMPSITRLGWKSGSLTSLTADHLPPNLLHLILTDNKIDTMDDPEIFFKLRHVKKLMLSHNNIESFGANGGVEQMQQLELIRLGGNRLINLPSEIWTLPSLSWMAISGNPMMDNFAQNETPNLPIVSMNDLTSLDNYLGQGASGKVSLFQWNHQKVALKLIHGVTSDGKAEDELSIYNAVGTDSTKHRVVGAIALLNDKEKKGVVMEPIPSSMIDLADPPTISEITADRWDKWNAEMFKSDFVRNALQDAVTALLFLHDFGISHGDFYAHNVKVDPITGRLYLLDFGASFLKGSFNVQAERIEVRAFGILVGELMDLLDPSEKELAKKLEVLRDTCIDKNVGTRPLFKEIKSMIENL